MKLFTTQEIDKREKEKTNSKILDGMKISKAIDKEQKILNDLHKERREYEKNQKEALIKIESEYRPKREALIREVENLQARRIELMKPVDEILEKTKEKEKEVTIALEEIEEKKALLTKRIAEVNRQENEAKNRVIEANELFDKASRTEKKALLKKKDIDDREENFNKAVKDAELLIKSKMAVIKAKEDDLLVREAKITEKDKFFKNKQKDIDNQLIRIKSERLALEATQREIYGRRNSTN